MGEGRIIMEQIKKRKSNWLGHWLRRNCLKGCSEGMVNGKKVRGRRRYQMIDNILINGLHEDTKRKAEKRVGVENAGFAMKDLLLGRTL